MSLLFLRSAQLMPVLLVCGHTLSSKVLLPADSQSWTENSSVHWNHWRALKVLVRESHLREYLIRTGTKQWPGRQDFSKFLSCFSYVVKLESSGALDVIIPVLDVILTPLFLQKVLSSLSLFFSIRPTLQKQASKQKLHTQHHQKKQKTLPNTLPVPQAAECGPKSPVGPSTAGLTPPAYYFKPSLLSPPQSPRLHSAQNSSITLR